MILIYQNSPFLFFDYILKKGEIILKKYLPQYISDFEKELNVSLMNKDYDLPLVEYVMDAWKSLEIVKNIKILKFEYNDNESEIDINKFIFKREKRKKKKERCDYKFINN